MSDFVVMSQSADISIYHGCVAMHLNTFYVAYKVTHWFAGSFCRGLKGY